MLKRITIIIFVFATIIPLFAQAAGEGVVINSFQIAGLDSDGKTVANDEFVELKNNTSQTVNLSGWQLGKVNLTGNSSNLVSSFPSLNISPGEKIIIGHPTYSKPVALRYSSGSYYLSNDSTIILKGPKDSDNNRAVVDRVGYGKAVVFDVAPIPNPEPGQIYARRNGGQDTDNNKNDFYLSYNPPKEAPPVDSEPINKEEVSVGATAGAKIKVSELMINPEGSDADGEWIEIYNAGSDANISSYIIIDQMGSPKKYQLPKGTKIKKGQYLAFYSGKTPISLNNDGDAVEIQNPEGKVISFSENSGKGAEGMSFAWSGSGWSWTKRPTPGAANIIEKPTEAELSGSKTKSENGEVLSLVDENKLPAADEISRSETAKNNDQIMGYGLIALAIFGGISYTLYINKEKLREFYYNRIRKRDLLTGSKIWQRLKRR